MWGADFVAPTGRLGWEGDGEGEEERERETGPAGDSRVMLALPSKTC